MAPERDLVDRAPAPDRRSARVSGPSARAFGLLAAATASVGLIGLTLGTVLDVAHPPAQVAAEQVVNVTGPPIAVASGSPAANALVRQFAAAGSQPLTLNHAVALPAGQAQPVRTVVLLHACKGAVSVATCSSTVLSFPPGTPPPLTADGAVLLRGAYRVSPMVDEQAGPGYLLQAAR